MHCLGISAGTDQAQATCPPGLLLYRGRCITLASRASAADLMPCEGGGRPYSGRRTSQLYPTATDVLSLGTQRFRAWQPGEIGSPRHWMVAESASASRSLLLTNSKPPVTCSGMTTSSLPGVRRLGAVRRRVFVRCGEIHGGLSLASIRRYGAKHEGEWSDGRRGLHRTWAGVAAFSGPLVAFPFRAGRQTEKYAAGPHSAALTKRWRTGPGTHFAVLLSECLPRLLPPSPLQPISPTSLSHNHLSSNPPTFISGLRHFHSTQASRPFPSLFRRGSLLVYCAPGSA